MPLPQDDPLQRKPDISLAKRELGWEPQVALDQGLDRTIAYFRSVVGTSDRAIDAEARLPDLADVNA